ncbi:MAG: NEW3 domain-containing protein [Anaerolineae bacterium]|nr:NEW3 domain-containing protein [Anaerolineae bacterium]
MRTAADTVLNRTFDSLLTAMQPGEARMVAQGTEIAYTLGSGSNTLHLPPLWVAAPHIIARQGLASYGGSSASFEVVLTNPAATPDVYSLQVSGLPAGWSVTLPASVNIAAGATVTETMVIQMPQDALGDYPLTVSVENGAGGTDQASGLLQVSGTLDVAVTPPWLESSEGVAVEYTVTITNHTPSGETVTLVVTGLDDHGVTLASSLPVPASGSLFRRGGDAASGRRPSAFCGDRHCDQQRPTAPQAILDVVGLRTVGVSIDPASAAGGPGSPAQFTVTVTNTGTLSDTYTWM